MKKWRRNFSLAVLTAGFLALAPSLAGADSCGSCDPCDPCAWDPCSFGDFEIGADFLWWKPCVKDLDVLASYDEHSNDAWHTNVKYKDICPDWEPGVRVYFYMPDFMCCWGLGASWTYINPDDSTSLSKNEGVISPILHLEINDGNIYDKGKVSWDAEYHEWDVIANYDIKFNDCTHFKPFFGVAGIFFDQELKGTFHDNGEKRATVDWEGDYWGVGLRVGTEYVCQFSDCMRFYTKASGTLLAGEACSNNTQKSFDSEGGLDDILKWKDDDRCLIVPGCYAAVGFLYDTSFCDFDMTFKLGYEFTYWHDLPSHRVNANPKDEDYFHAHATSASNRDFGFHGLTAGLAFSF